jgi:large subunit ribosomal protein L17
MQHNKSGRKLGRKSGHRLALFRNQLASLITSERIVTTLPKAKELRPLAERMVTQGKRGTVHARRLVGRWILQREVIKKLFDEIAPRFSTRPGGYLRIVKLGPRLGDGAEMAVIEFVDFELKTAAAPEGTDEKAAKGKGKAKKSRKQAAATPELEPEEEGAQEKPAAKKPGKAAPKKKAAKPAPASKPGGRKAEHKAEKAAPKGKAHTTKSPVATRKSTSPKKIGGS